MKIHVYRAALALARPIILLLGLLSAAYAAVAGPQSGNYYFRTLDSNSGLSNNSVNAIIQDRRGMMVFATKDGLNFYNGLSCRTFRKDNSTLGNDFILSLYEAEDGHIWVGTDGGAFIYDPETDHFSPFDVKSQPVKSGNAVGAASGEVIRHAVAHISPDARGRILLSSQEQGLFAYNLKNQTLVRCNLHTAARPGEPARRLNANVSLIWIEDGRQWIGLYEDNLYVCDDLDSGLCTPFTTTDGQEPFRGTEINCQLDCGPGRRYVGTNRGFFEINTSRHTASRILDAYVRSCTIDANGQLWVGTEKGIFILNPVTGTVLPISASPTADEYSLADNAVYALCRDREGGIWAGTYFGGVGYYNAQNSLFHKLYPSAANPTFGRRVREIIPAGDGALWIGTEDRGLFHYTPSTGALRPFTHPALYPNIHGLCLVGSDLWVGTFSGGLNRIDTRTGQLRHYGLGSGPGQFPAHSVFSICHTTSGALYCGTIGGLFRYDAASDTFSDIPAMCGQFVYQVLEDHLGNLWCATYSSGVFRYDRATGRLTHFTPQREDTGKEKTLREGGVVSRSLTYHKVIGLYEDSRHRIWMATQGGGACAYDPKTRLFTCYTTSEGLPSNVVLAIVEDGQGAMWLTTGQGLVRLDVRTGEMRHFRKAGGGLLSDQFNYRSGLCTADGTLFLGTTSGLLSFHPQEFRSGNEVPTLLVSDFFIGDSRADIGPDGPLQRSIQTLDRITLRVNQNTFSVRAAVMSYQSPAMNEVRYRLEGLDDTWHVLAGTDLIRYADLRYGKYRLHIVGRSSDGLETAERIISIRIRPPFYLSIWAYLLYALLTAGFGYYTYRTMHGRTLRRHARAMERLRQEKERELYDAKIEFFTNVAHEIRTPLTLIKNPLESVLSQSAKLPAACLEDLETMTLNTDRLLGLVNELLDFRKTETKGFQMHFAACDLAALLRRTHTRFLPLARHSGLDFTLDAPEVLTAHVDQEGFTKIVSNLFTNAIKYGEHTIHVVLSAEDGDIVLRVTNDGPVVPPGKREEIFASFTRYYNDGSDHVPGSRPIGTGIGLTLARSLATLHGGSLGMDDDLTVNCFVLRIPRTATKTSPNPSEGASPDPSEGRESVGAESVLHAESFDDVDAAVGTTGTPSAQTDSPPSVGSGEVVHTILVVEDNLEMQAFIRRQLSPHYRVLTADDGAQALEVLNESTVHVIVSDVMMPVMDGMALLARVKQDLAYSHIPFILLTARVGVQATVEGLEQGADAYIEKPFSTEHLLASIANLLRSRALLRAAYRNNPVAQSESLAISKPDEEFLNRLREVTLQGMKNADFSVDQMAADLAMSRSSLGRKIRALLDVSPADYVRLERLKYAAELLQSGRYKINEVCYMAGFNTPSYFAKCFQKQFGMLPGEFRDKSES